MRVFVSYQILKLDSQRANVSLSCIKHGMVPSACERCSMHASLCLKIKCNRKNTHMRTHHTRTCTIQTYLWINTNWSKLGMRLHAAQAQACNTVRTQTHVVVHSRCSCHPTYCSGDDVIFLKYSKNKKKTYFSFPRLYHALFLTFFKGIHRSRPILIHFFTYVKFQYQNGTTFLCKRTTFCRYM